MDDKQKKTPYEVIIEGFIGLHKLVANELNLLKADFSSNTITFATIFR